MRRAVQDARGARREALSSACSASCVVASRLTGSGCRREEAPLGVQGGQPGFAGKFDLRARRAKVVASESRGAQAHRSDRAVRSLKAKDSRLRVGIPQSASGWKRRSPSKSTGNDRSGSQQLAPSCLLSSRPKAYRRGPFTSEHDVARREDHHALRREGPRRTQRRRQRHPASEATGSHFLKSPQGTKEVGHDLRSGYAEGARSEESAPSPPPTNLSCTFLVFSPSGDAQSESSD